MDDNVPKENLCLFKDVLECSIAYELSEDYLSKAQKGKVIHCSNRRKDSLNETIGSSSIQCHKNFYVTYTSNDHRNRYLKRKWAAEPGTSQVKRSRRSWTGILDLKKHCIICGEYCTVIRDKKHPDRLKKNRGFRCTTADRGKENLSSKETPLQVNENENAYITSERKYVLLKVQQDVFLKVTTISLCGNP